MPCPVSRGHGLGQIASAVWLSDYAENTPGVEALTDATTILGWRTEPHPDVLLCILPECGGQTRNERGYVHGAAELVVKVSRANRYIDLGPKLADYDRAGVLEYVVRALDPDDVLWFRQGQGALARAGRHRRALLLRHVPRPLARPAGVFGR